LGGSVQFSSSDASVNWSINGVQQASGIYGTITTNGLYTAPLSLPSPAYISITATDTVDTSATAGTDVHVVAASPGTISTVAGNGTAGYSGDGSAAVAAELYNPTGIAFDGGGNMFIADESNNVIRKVDASTQIITTIAGTGVAGYSGDGGPGTTAELNQPAHVVFDRTVNLYITDSNNERIRKVDALTDEITTVAGNGTTGFSGDGGPATSAQFNFPDGVALDSNGNLYVGDAYNNRIREVTISTRDITTVAGDGTPGYAGDGGIATNSELDFPSRPFIDSAGDIYIADFQNNRVRKVDASNGIITTIAGDGVAGFAGDGGAATIAELNGPLSVALDPSGVLYIADVNNERIRAVNTTANSVTVMGVTIQPGQIKTVVGNGHAGYYGDGGSGTNAEVYFPTGLTIDSAGNLYFADEHNNVVRKVIRQ
jgi:sugar lactone lactonase YvrE